MLDVYLVSALLEKPGLIGHKAFLQRAGSGEEAEGLVKELAEVDGWKLVSVEATKASLGWYREDGK